MQLLPTSKLYAATLTALNDRPRTLTYDAIASFTGLETKWLRNFKRAKRPCVHRTEALYAYLTGKELAL